MKINFYFILSNFGHSQYPYKYPYRKSSIGGLKRVLAVAEWPTELKPLIANGLHWAFTRSSNFKNEEFCGQKWLFCFTKLSVFRQFAGQMTKNSLFFLSF